MTCNTALWIVFVVGPVACGDAADPQTITMRAAVTFSDGSSIRSVTYAAVSSLGVTLAAGTIAVSDPSAALSLNLMLPPGSGDVVELAATTNAGASCTGKSAPFDVVAGGSTSINLTLVCGGNQAASASCPEIQAWTVTPAQAAAPNGTVSADVTVTEAGATEPVSYTWTATAGVFSDPSAASTTYTCTAVGSQKLTLTVTEGTPPSACATTAVFPVDCIAGANAGASSP